MQVLPGGPLVPTSQEGGNVTDTNKYAMTAPGSLPVTPLPPGFVLDDTSLPLPKIPGEQIPVSTQPGNYGGQGLPAARPASTAGLRQPGTQPGTDGGGFTAGLQPGGQQGGGNATAGDSGPGGLWKKTPGAAGT